MMAVAWALLAVLIGCGLVVRFGGDLTTLQPRWAAAMLVFGSGALAGVGLTSCLFFLCRLAAPGMPRLGMFIEIAIFGWLVFAISRDRKTSSTPGAAIQALFVPWLMGGVLVAFGIVTAGMAVAWDANPQGNWDAWSIWNLRARFLTAGHLPQRAWSASLTETHPEYPLLVSGAVARCWAYAGSMTEAGPIAISYLFFLALLATLTGGLAVHRGRTLGLLAGLALLGSPTVMHEAGFAQYADVPLACYMAGATMLALLDRPLLAGLFAGLAMWTKDEGTLFLAIFLVAIALIRRERLVRVAMGAIPGVLLTLILKIALSPRSSMYFMGGPSAVFHRAIDGRFWQILSAFITEFSAMGFGWYHPILPLLALAIGLSFERERRKDLFLAAAIPCTMLVGYFGIYLISPFPMKWHLSSSLNRLLVQVWPSIILAVVVSFSRLERAVIQAPAAPAKPRKKSRTS